MICLRSSSSIGRSSVSCCKATVDVVLKHPVIIFIARHCTDVRLLSCEVAGEFRMSSGLCQMAAPYWILSLMTTVYSLLMYLKGVPHIILAILDSTRANFVPFFVVCAKWVWNFNF